MAVAREVKREYKGTKLILSVELWISLTAVLHIWTGNPGLRYFFQLLDVFPLKSP